MHLGVLLLVRAASRARLPVYLPPDRRVEIRRAEAAPIFDGLKTWPQFHVPTILGKSPLAQAIHYALTRMMRLRHYLGYGIFELDSNTAERATRSVAVGRKNNLFVGSQIRRRVGG